jgi:hypothetical protein
MSPDWSSRTMNVPVPVNRVEDVHALGALIAVPELLTRRTFIGCVEDEVDDLHRGVDDAELASAESV